jgi:hypothetical protein
MNGFRRTAQSDPFNIEVPDNHFTSAVSEYAGWGYFDFRRRGEGFAEGFQSMPANGAISSARTSGRPGRVCGQGARSTRTSR